MAQIILENTEMRVFMTTEYHDVVCRRRGVCKCKVSRVVGPRGKGVSKKDPSSFRIPAKSKSEPMDVEVLHLQHVKDALVSGWLKRHDYAVRDDVPAPAPKPKAPPKTVTKPKPASEGGE